MAEKRKMNPFIMLFVGAIIIVAIYLILSANKEKYMTIDSVPSLYSKDKAKDGDTQADTIRALQAYAKEAVEKAKQLNDETRTQSKQVEDNKNIALMLEEENKRNNVKLRKNDAYTKTLEGQIKTLNDKLDTIITEKESNVAELPVGFGFDQKIDKSKGQAGQWHHSIDYIDEEDGGKSSSGFTGIFKRTNQAQKGAASTVSVVKEALGIEKVEPYYTLHKDAILFDSLAFTALIGRIPVEGVTPDPYPVKIFIGRENLLANGFDMPEIEGMVFSGLGFGDWNLSCVSARLYSATFIFDDGTIVNQTESEPLAYISDRTGIPCISGEFVSNAKEFIAQQVALSGLGAAGSAYADAQLETVESDSGQRRTSLIGDIAKVVGGNVVKASTDEVSEWLLARQKQSFEAVVVDPGERVSIHLEKEIIIDHKEFSRKVRYERNNPDYENTLD